MCHISICLGCNGLATPIKPYMYVPPQADYVGKVFSVLSIQFILAYYIVSKPVAFFLGHKVGLCNRIEGVG